MIKRIILLLFITIVSSSTFAQGVKVSIDTNAILIGEQVKVDLEFKFPSEKRGYFVFVPDSISPNLDIIERSRIDTSFQNGITRYYQQLKVTAFDSGYFVLPAFQFGYQEKDDSIIQLIISDPHLINVFTVDADTTQPIKPLVGPLDEPYTLMEFLPWIALGLLVLILLFVGIYYFRKRKKKPLFKSKEEPLIPPHIKALENLDLLRLKKLWQAESVKLYYSELTDILRTYIEDRYHIMAIEMTTHETLEELEKHAINDEVMHKLRSSLELADLVKFAKAKPSSLENDTCLNHGIDFVNETKFNAPELKEKEDKDVG